MKSEVAQTKLDEFASLMPQVEQDVSHLSDGEVLEQAKKAMYDLTHPYQDGINNVHHEVGGPAVWASDGIIEWLADPVSPNTDQSLGSQVDRNAVIREFLIRSIPKLNETFDLGLTFDEGERG